MPRLPTARVLDVALDRSLLGYTRLGTRARQGSWPADPPPGALEGRRVLVTGATGGLGTAIGRGVAELGATVHLMGRNPDKVAASAASLRSDVPGAEVVEEVLDLGDLDAVHAWADDALGRLDSLTGLVHNAGTMTKEREESPQGHELGLAVHVLAPHLLTSRLREPLAAAGRDGGASVVWMSSGGMYSAGLRHTPETIQYRDGTYDGVRAYARTKRMQVVLADRWARALGGRGIKVESMHPGWAATPGLTDHLPGFEKVVGRLLRTAEEGADTAVWLVATRPTSYPPHFWHDRRQRPSTFGWQRGDDVAHVQDLLAYVEQVTDAPFQPR